MLVPNCMGGMPEPCWIYRHALVKHISGKPNRFLHGLHATFHKFAAAISTATAELHAQLCTLFFVSLPFRKFFLIWIILLCSVMNDAHTTMIIQFNNWLSIIFQTSSGDIGIINTINRMRNKNSQLALLFHGYSFLNNVGTSLLSFVANVWPAGLFEHQSTACFPCSVSAGGFSHFTCS